MRYCFFKKLVRSTFIILAAFLAIGLMVVSTAPAGAADSKNSAEHCRKKHKSKIAVVDCIDGRGGMLSMSFAYFYYKKPDRKKAQITMRLSLLDMSAAKAKRVRTRLTKLPFVTDDFLDLYDTTLSWADKQKQLSATKLYNKAINLPEWAKNSSSTELFKLKYLSLADKRGSKNARKALDQHFAQE